MKTLQAAFAGTVLATLLALAGCGGGGDPAPVPAPAPPPAVAPPPTALSYPGPAVAAIGQVLPAVSPMVTGSVTAYSVTPALPAGLTLDTTTGVISGTPTVVAATASYTITATNASGSTTFILQLTVNPTAQAGSALTVEAGTFVTLDGTASATTPGHVLTYAWTLRSVPTGSSAGLASPSSPKPVFKADLTGVFAVDLVVTDGGSQSAASTVTVTVVPATPFVPPATPANSQAVTGCQEITAPGNYVLTGDLMSQTSAVACINIHDTSDVVLDCAHHTVSEGPAFGPWVLAANHVQHLTVQNCTLVGRIIPLDYLSDSLLVGNTFNALPASGIPDRVDLTHPARVSVDHNTLVGSWVNALYGDSLAISNNSFVMSTDAGAILGGFVLSFYGIHLTVTGNVMDGRWDGLTGSQYTYNGADDGVVLTDESAARVEGNTIGNVFDTGIEWLGLLKDSTLRANLVVNAGYAGFGGWYWVSEVNDQFVNNTVRNGNQMFWISHTYGIRPAGYDPEQRMPADAGVLIQANLFDGNVSSGGWNPSGMAAEMPVFGAYAGGTILSPIAGERAVVDADLQYANNTFQNNWFDPAMAEPNFYSPITPGIIIDGGGNACGKRVNPPGPLACH